MGGIFTIGLEFFIIYVDIFYTCIVALGYQLLMAINKANQNIQRLEKVR